MSALREFQIGFQAYLVGGQADAVASHFKAGFEQNAGIYRNNVHHAHSGALAALYPAVQALVGEDYFGSIARQFAHYSPPKSAILAAYGAEFADMLTLRPELSQFPYLPDVARLEWAINEAFHAQGVAALRPENALTLFDAGHVTFRLIESLRMVAARFPVHTIRLAALDEDVTTLQQISPCDTWLLIIRPEAKVRVLEISKGEAAFLASCSSGHSIEQAVTVAMASDPVFSPVEALGRLLHFGAFRAQNHRAKDYNHD